MAHALRSGPALRAICGLLASAAAAQGPLVEIKVTGNERLPSAAVIAASGLRLGQKPTRTDLNAAVQRALDTGFFSLVTYRYDPKISGGANGYLVTLQVSEEPARMPVELDIPGQDAERLWYQLKSEDGLVDRQIPGNDRASVYYKRAIEAVLRTSGHPEEIVMKTEADLVTHKVRMICRPAHLPRVASIRFEGNAAIDSDTLETALARVAIGQELTERDFRRMLELNVRPLYEDLGRLTVAFPQVRLSSAGSDRVAATAAIEEGPVWRLGKVDLAGEALPLEPMRDAAHFAEGAPANWKQFMACIHEMEKVLRSNGYISVSSQPRRSFRDTSHMVDVTVEISKGPQFRFGELHIDGLDAKLQQRVAALWILPSGAPMNELYVQEFQHAAVRSLAGKIKSVHSAMQIHADSHEVDVTIAFN